MKVRYIRESMNGNNTNTGCHWLEIQALNYDGINVALNKEVTTKNEIADGKLDMVTDGDYSITRNYLALKNTNLESTSLIIDLKTIENIDIIKVWHYYGESNRKYNHILLETSIDGIEWTKIFDSDVDGEYIEASEGKTHKLPIEEELKELDDSASLNEVIAFYEKYIESNKQNKKMLKNILAEKNIDIDSDTKMLGLINAVEWIEETKKYEAGENLSIFSIDKGQNTYFTASYSGSSTSTIIDFFKIECNFEGSVRFYANIRVSSAYGNYISVKHLSKDGYVKGSYNFSATNTSLAVYKKDFPNIEKGDFITYGARSNNASYLSTVQGSEIALKVN